MRGDEGDDAAGKGNHWAWRGQSGRFCAGARPVKIAVPGRNALDKRALTPPELAASNRSSNAMSSQPTHVREQLGALEQEIGPGRAPNALLAVCKGP